MYKIKKKGFNVMAISLGQAFKSIKEDEHWIKKFVIYAIIVYIIPLILGAIFGLFSPERLSLENISTQLIIYIVIGLICSSYGIGFLYLSANKALNTGSYKMIEWSEKNLLLSGVKIFVKIIGWILALTILLIPIIFIEIALLSLVGFLIVLLLNALSLDSNIISAFSVAFISIFNIIFFLYFYQYANTAIAFFIKNLRFKDFFAFKRQFKLMIDNKHLCWSLLGKMILLGLLILLLVVVCTVTIIGIILIPFIYVITYFAMFNLFVQFAKEAHIERYFES